LYDLTDKEDEMILSVAGAYGRDYHKWETALTDWLKGLDFKIVVPGTAGGPYCTMQDEIAIKATGYTHIEFLEHLTNEKLLMIKL
jgi:hypothetical protein